MFPRATIAAGWFLALTGAGGADAQNALAPPPPGKLYQGFFYSAVAPESDDANEHNVTAADVREFEEATDSKTTWVYFSDNWFESRAFPEATRQ